jgi:hypothetical protein
MKYLSYSRENQDLFILSVLAGKKGGTYVEIGTYMPILDNNTYLLESEFGWRGISLDCCEDYVSNWVSSRRNPLVICDATTVNYIELFETFNLPNHIDFLQIDIDPTSANYRVLESIDFEKYTFSVITFEHNLYLSGDGSYYGGDDCEYYRNKSREYLSKYGYTCLVPDVCHKDKIFEDWYIKEEHMVFDNWKGFIGVDSVMNTSNMKESTKKVFEEFL